MNRLFHDDTRPPAAECRFILIACPLTDEVDGIVGPFRPQDRFAIRRYWKWLWRRLGKVHGRSYLVPIVIDGSELPANIAAAYDGIIADSPHAWPKADMLVRESGT